MKSSVEQSKVPQITDNSTVQDATPQGNNNGMGNNMDYLGYALQTAPLLYNTIRGMGASEVDRYGRVTPRTIDLEPQRREMRQNAITTGNIARHNLLSQNAGSYATNVGVTNAAIQGNLGNQLGQSYLSQDSTNSQIRSGVDRENLQVGMQESIANSQNRAARRNFLSATSTQAGQLAGTIGQNMSQNRQQSMVLKMMQTKNWFIDEKSGGYKWRNGTPVTSQDMQNLINNANN